MLESEPDYDEKLRLTHGSLSSFPRHDLRLIQMQEDSQRRATQKDIAGVEQKLVLGLRKYLSR